MALGSFGSENGKEGMPKTTAWIALDDTFLYLAIHCQEPKPEAIVTRTLVEERKAAVWGDDSVEVFLDPGNTGHHLFQLVVNTRGTYYDGAVRFGQSDPLGWNSEAVARTALGEDGWSVELAIPFATLGHAWARGEVVALNVARNRHATRPSRHEGLAGGELHFRRTETYPRFLIDGTLKAESAELVSTRRGPFLTGAPGVWEFQILQGEPKEIEALFAPAGGRPTSRPLERKGAFMTFSFGEKSAAAVASCRLHDQGKEIYASSHEVSQVSAEVERIAVTREPIFQPLVEPFPKGLARHGVLNWVHELMPAYYNFSVRTGAVWSPELALKEYGRDRTSLVSLRGHWSKPWMKLDQLAAEKVGVAAYLDSRPFLQGGGLFGAKTSRPYPLTQAVVKAYEQDLTRVLEIAGEHGNFNYIFAGDEMWELELHRNLLGLLDQKERPPELIAIDREIREKYGFGKYGLPKSSTESDPFSWIATFRWEIDRMLAIQHKVKAKMADTDLKLISWDNIGGHRPYAISRWGEVFDIITFQLYPSMNPQREDFGFVTRFYHDLSGSAEIWPVPHVEHYAASFRPDEVEELLSQVWRNGATGLHLYSDDTLHLRKGSGYHVTDRIGAPERWQVVRSLMERLPMKVRQPEVDTAIFYSNTSFQATGPGGGHSLVYSAHNEPEWLYTILGPRLGGAFRFIDEVTTARDPAALSRFKQIYIPYMPIADDAEVAALEAYVRKGGSLVICDPLAFGYRSDGTRRESGALLPPLAGAAQGPQPLVNLLDEAQSELIRIRPTYPLLKGAGEALASYGDGSDAIIETELDQGKLIFFGTNPLFSNLIGDKNWIAFFGALQARVEAAKDQTVWRFRLPPTPLKEEAVPERGLCLTGNYFQWRLSVPTPMANASFAGGYTLGTAPVGNKEAVGQEIAFSLGRLTNRLKGAKGGVPQEREAYPPMDDWSLSWSGKEPVEITFSFARPVTPGALRFFYSERLPAGRCEISTDGKEWQPLAAWEGGELSEEPTVALERVALSSQTKGRYVRLLFDPAAGPFTLVETEIWGE